MVGVYHAAQPKFVNLTAPVELFSRSVEHGLGRADFGLANGVVASTSMITACFRSIR